MGTTLEVLVTRLEADIKDYKKGMRDAQKTTQSSTKKMDKSMAALAKRFVAWAAVVMVARRAYRAFTQTMADVDALAKTADFLGMTTEALAGLELQGKLTGVSMGNIQTSLMRMTRALGEAATGSKEYIEPFERINVDYKELLQMAPEQQMAEIAEGIAGLTTQTEQGAAAMEIFGRSGMRMLNLLRQGREGFEKAAKEAKEFGTAISRIDAAKIEAANDAITRAKEAAKGLGIAIAVSLSPEIEKLAKLVVEATKFWRAYAEESSKAKDETDNFRDSVLLAGIAAGELITQQLPEWRPRFAELALRAKEAVVEGAGISGDAGPTGTYAPEGADLLMKSLQAAAVTRYQELTDSLRSETQLIEDEYQERMDFVAHMEEIGIGNRIVWNELRASVHKDGVDKILEITEEGEQRQTEIAKQGADARRKVSAMGMVAMTSDLLGSMGRLVSVMDSESRKAFETTKALNLASAITHTGAGMMRAHAELLPPASWLQAAAVGVEGAIQIANIAKTQYKGGGGAPAAGGGGAGAAAGGAAAAAPSQKVMDVGVTLHGGIGDAQVRELMEAIAEQQEDGVLINSITVTGT